MPRIDTGLAHQLAYRQRFSRGCRLLGCIAFLAGGMLAASPLLLTAEAASHETAGVVAVIGVLLAALGLVLLFGRRGKLFDKEEGTVALWWGVGPRWHEDIYELGEFSQIIVRPPSDHAGPWQISLANAAGEALPLFRLASETAARVAAEEVAGFLNLPLVLAPPEPPSPPAEAEAPSTASAGKPALPPASAIPPTSPPPGIERAVTP